MTWNRRASATLHLPNGLMQVCHGPVSNRAAHNNQPCILLDAICPLNGAHEGDDLGHVVLVDFLHSRHVAEFPVVLARANGSG